MHWTTRGASQVALGSHRNSAQPTTRNLLAGATNPGGGILSGLHNMVDRLTCATHDVSTAFTSRAEQSESIPECSVLNRSTYLSSVTVDNGGASGRLNAADAGGDGLGELSTASALNRSGGIGICGGGGSKIPRLGRSTSGTSGVLQASCRERALNVVEREEENEKRREEVFTVSNVQACNKQELG